MNVNLRAVAAETLSIIERGSYQRPGGGDVQLAEQIAKAVAGTRLIPWNRQQLGPGHRAGALAALAAAAFAREPAHRLVHLR